MWQRRRSDASDNEGSLVDECQAYLGGTYRSWLEQAGQAVPGWAWVNELAHADLCHLRELAAAPVGPPRSSPSWRHVVGALAAEVLARSRGEGPEAARLLREAILPLELQLIDHRQDVEVTPATLLAVGRLRLSTQGQAPTRS